MKDQRYYLAFSYCLGIGPMRLRQLTSHFGSVKDAYLANTSELQHVLGFKIAEQLIRFRTHFKPDSIFETLLKKNIQIITFDQPEYPQTLSHISDPPICLYIKGDKKILSHPLILAVVGTRKPTSYGVSATERIVKELALYGFSIISGMAIGIDSTAHCMAITSQSPTIAVLGCGVDIIYPPSNRSLYNSIIEKGGAVISEFPPGSTVHPGLFVARNRIISGLARGVLVVEGSNKSGSLITARYAGEQGRDVFAIPSPITSPLSSAPNYLIKNGAKMVTSVDDIVEEYSTVIKRSKKEDMMQDLKGLEKEMVEYLLNEPFTIDDIVKAMQKPVKTILHTVSILEIQGIIATNSEGKLYVK